jgi:hypothetical protein
MEDTKELTLQDLMQMLHDIKEMQRDFDMITEFITVDELKTILKEKRNE